jgi:hypothetical protein
VPVRELVDQRTANVHCVKGCPKENPGGESVMYGVSLAIGCDGGSGRRAKFMMHAETVTRRGERGWAGG